MCEYSLQMILNELKQQIVGVQNILQSTIWFFFKVGKKQF
jgi:hypothetical protein